jgi:hypothetical protein
LHPGSADHNITQRHPAPLSSPSRPRIEWPLPVPFPPISSSASKSAGLTVMCTTFVSSSLNGKSRFRRRCQQLVTNDSTNIYCKSVPFNGALSSMNLPKIIRRMLLGLAGRGSHSDRQSVHISSFSLYPLISLGSNADEVLLPDVSTLRLRRYFSSIL